MAEEDYVFSTKGDNNKGQIKMLFVDETSIHESQVIGTAFFKIPWIGYVKILSVDGLCRIYPFGFCLSEQIPRIG